MLYSGSKIKKTGKTIEGEVDGEIVIANVDNGEYYAMNGIGRDIWKHLNEPISFENLLSKLLEEYDVSKNVCEEQTIIFLEKLLERRIIDISH